MKKLLIINTGGTFNKIYNPITGELSLSPINNALDSIASKWFCTFEIVHIIGKDSLYMTSQDRLALLETINQSNHSHIIIIHGTDTMDITATYLAKKNIDKSIVLTGAMVPYFIDPVEATANFTSAYGYLQSSIDHGIYIVMNGVFGSYDKVKKDRDLGKFTLL